MARSLPNHVDTASDLAALKSGLYRDVPEPLYHQLDACSNSRLTLLQRSPAHAKEAIDNPQPSTDAQQIGTATHWAILDPDLFRERVDVAEQCEAITGKGTQCSYTGKVRVDGSWYCNRHAPDAPADDLLVIDADTRDQIAAMREQVEAHPTAGALVSMPGVAEATALFEHEGLYCKARLDYWGPETGTLVDLKTTRDAQPDAFQRSIWNYGYFRQLAFYRYALEQLGKTVDEALIIAVEKNPPYAVAVYRLSEETLSAGWRQLEDLLDRYARCIQTDEWPGYGEDVKEIGLPSWAWNRL